MRAPFQEGDFPGPVKYGYLNVGVVEPGPPSCVGRTVFCLYPHQTAYVVPAEAVVAGAGRRAAGAGGAGRHRGDRGQRAVGRRAAGRRPGHGGRRRHGRLLRRRAAGPASRASTVAAGRRRPRPGRGRRARSASTFATPAEAAGGRDLVIHASATAAGLQRSLDLLAPEGTVIELSWYGDREVEPAAGRRVPLRPADHPRQPGRHGRRRPAGPAAAYADRLALALDLLRDPAFDALLTGESRFDELPEVLAGLAAGTLPALCHLITYGGE